MWRAIRETLVLLLLVAVVGACAAAPVPSATADRTHEPTLPLVSWEPGVPGLAMSAIARVAANPADAALASAAINDFGVELLRGATANDENAVLSPASIVLALAMARAGARGDTAAEMDEVLRGVASDEHAGWLNALDAALAVRSGTFKDRFNKDADVLLRIANQSFAQAGFPWEDSYLDALAARFGAGLQLVDFKQHAEETRRDINAWVAERTEERIPELLPQGSVDVLTRLVLVNAIYLKAAWSSPFQKERTVAGAFSLLDGSRIDVPTMHDTSGFRYAEGTDWQAVELPYVGRQLAMLIVLPDDLLTFEPALDGATLEAITSALEDQRVKLSLPRFGIESELDLNAALAAMGMPLAFDPLRADFSGITPVDDLYVSGVLHQANIDVDEEGTEAAAATGVVMGITSMPPEPIPMAVDRPFLFALRDLETGAILFLGRVVEPMERS